MTTDRNNADEEGLLLNDGYGDLPEPPTYRGLKLTAAAILLVIVAVGAFLGWRSLTPIDHLARAREFLAAEEYSSAIIDLKHVIKANPRDGEMRWLIGNAYLKLRQNTYAAEYLQEAYDLGYRDPELMRSLARSKLLVREYEDALKLYREWSDVESNIDAASWEVIRGRSLLNLGRQEKAVEAFLQALRLNPSSREAKWGLAESGIGADLSGLTREEVQRALSTGLDHPETWILRGELELSRRNFTDSRSAFERAAELGPNNVYGLAGLVRVLIASNQLEDAREPVEELAQSFSTDPMSAYVRALYFRQIQDYEQALAALKVVLAHEPDHAMSTLLLGEVQYAMGDLELALESLGRFHRRVPDSVLGRKRLAEVQIESNLSQRAVALLEPLVDQVHRDPEIATLLATAYAKLGDTRRAKAYQSLSFKLDSETAGPRVALEHLNTGETEEAIEELELLVAHEPEKLESRIMLAVSQLRAGDYAEALAISSALLEERPDDPQVQYLHGSALELSGDAAQAVSYYERALELDPQYSMAELGLARIELDSGYRNAARSRIEGVLDRDPNNATAQVWLAQMAMQDGNSAAAISRLEAARTSDNSALQPRLILADLYLQQGNVDGALTVSRELVKLTPNHPAGQYLLGNAHVLAGNIDEAILIFEQLEETQPDNLNLKWRIVEAQENKGDDAAVVDTLQRVLAVDQNNARALVKLAMIERAQGDAKAAVELADRLTRHHPEYGMGALINGQILMDDNKYREASGFLERAVALNRDSITVSRYYTALVMAGEVEKAEALMSSWLDANPADSIARLAVAEQAMRAGNVATAVEQYEWVVRREPENVPVLVLLAGGYHEMGDRRDLKTAQRAYELAPEDLYAKHAYAWLLVETGLSERGAELLRNVVKTAPGNATFRYHLAVALNDAGSEDEAREVLQPLLSTQVQFSEMAEAQALIDRLGVEPAEESEADD